MRIVRGPDLTEIEEWAQRILWDLPVIHSYTQNVNLIVGSLRYSEGAQFSEETACAMFGVVV